MLIAEKESSGKKITQKEQKVLIPLYVNKKDML